MTKQVFGEGRIALKFGNQKINLHQYEKEFEPKISTSNPGSGDLRFITETCLDKAMGYVQRKGMRILEGPAQRTGVVGSILSFYFRDPDGNLVEIAEYESNP